jgi:hypothetical protein
VSTLPRLLKPGEVLSPDDPGETIAQLRRQVADLRAQLDEMRDLAEALRQERRQSDMAVGSVRRQLQPLYGALQCLFGAMEDVASNSPLGQASRSPVWESWKSKLGGLPARFIEALEVHGPMTRTQLRIAVGCASSSVADTIYKLNRAGLIDKANGKISLKEMQ